MNSNLDSYKAWNIDEKDFPENGSIEAKIKFILGYGVLAPSTFNSQPWKCRIADNRLEIYLDRERITKKSDKSGRFAHVSMGAFIQNLLISADYFGLKADLKFSEKTVKNLKLVAVIDFSADKKKKNDLFKAIKKRATNRSVHKSKEIDKQIIKEINLLSDQAIQIIELDEKYKEKIIEISKTGDLNIWTDKGFRKEHVGWVRNNLTRKYDGMPGFGVNVGLLPSFLAPVVILSPIFPKFQMKKNVKALKSTHNSITICTKESVNDWLRLGMVFERIALMLTNKDINVSPMGQFIEDDEARKKLKELVKPNEDFSPQLFFRVGYSTLSVRHSPRLPVEKILI